MKRQMLALMSVACSTFAYGIMPSTSPDRVKAPLTVNLPRIGTLAPRTAAEVGDSMWTIGCECLDRDYADFEQYREFLPALGIRKIRLQAGWAKCEKERGKYDFKWLDDIVDWAIAHGLDPMLETGYGNPLYVNGGSAALMGSSFPSGEALEAWDKWVEALVNHFKDRVRDYEMWNESNNVKANTPKLIAEHNVHTAKIIKRVYPEARIAGLVLGGNWARDLELCLNEMGEDAKIFKWFMFHRYACNPESEIDVLLDRQALVKKFNPDGILRQGESGATSEMVKWFSFDGVPFTEITQAKTDLRRMLTDFACGIPTAVFTICDLHYRRNGRVSYNPKGLLRADDANRVIGVKRAYYAVQNCVSVFDAAVKPVAETQFENKDTTIFWREYEKGGAPLLAFWQYAEVRGDFKKTKEAPGFNLADGRTRHPRASDRCDTFPTVFRTKSPPMKEPVWVDLLTGRVYAIPAENVLPSESGTVYVDVPCYDSPALLTEKSALNLAPGRAFAGSALAPIDASPDRVKTPLKVDMERIGTIRPRAVPEIRDSNWTLGCETIERGYADFWQYADYIVPLGIKNIRIQTGWARCEPERGRFDFGWLDKIVDFAISKGVNVLLETSYGNPIYPNAGGWDLGAGFPTGEEGLAAWDRWVETLATHFKGRVRDWAMWNEPDIRNPALPGHEAAKTPQEIAVFNVRTAKIIRKVIPDSRIAGLSLATVKAEFFEDCLKTMGEDVKLFDWFIYHGYAGAPEISYGAVERLKEVLKKYHPTARMRQGENGCPSELATRFALSGVAWSEYSQAKWDMRRMLGDLGHDVESSVFTICDFNHTGREINRKGLLRANAGKKVIAVKRAYYAVQNVVSVFDCDLSRIAEPAITNVDISVVYYEYRNRAGLPLYAFWSCGSPERVTASANPKERRYRTVYERPGDSFETRPTVFTAKGAPMKDPVWVDLFTGRIYAYPKGNMRAVDGETFYLDVPVYDSPCLLTEREALNVVATPTFNP